MKLNDSAFLLLHADDNLVIAKRQVSPGETIVESNGAPPIATTASIDMGHKIARSSIAVGDPVRKFGQIIGFASHPIAPGEWIHSHNLTAGHLSLDYAFSSDIPAPPEPVEGRVFQGFRRADGRAATRNYVGIISTVNCSASVSKYAVDQIRRDILEQYPNVDGVVALTHKGGCAMQYDGEDHHQLARVLGGFAKHPNIGAYVIVGLGCETGQTGFLVDDQSLVQLKGASQPQTGSPLVLTIQETGGTAKTVNRTVELIKELLPEANKVQREAIPVSEIMLGCECGGSDGYSGITANPALGIASDLLVAHGATSILGETPEIYGGEHLLTRRAITPEVGQKLVDLMHWWEDYTGKFGTQIDNNPSPGNKKGGLTTIYEKSLGAIAKGGSTALQGVFKYAEPVTSRGFVVMDTPGYDPASVTGMVAGGANVVAFTTGRGSCFGCKPVPSIKIATNTPLYERMSDDMDFNAGKIVDGASVEEVGRELFEKVIAVASGEKTKSELQGLGDEEFCPWSIGPTL
ncbi:D-galactarate dehydratase [Polystyrenella longa]|uniref:D-galactarate dehydratase n=1 Tax=Polystyrenella longa TaxID=2528007 RepID=A0A518CIV3_9PLAN|nr:altronate dehydratase family protein [Polystyrenella longa]QDU79150.1 D-galactarate dehydratase [Polystyrenella longa]